MQDLARSYIVLRPLPHGAKLGDGPIGDDNNCRLIAVPKKTLPVTGNDKWTAFVEKANVSFKDLKEGFLKSNDYETSTQGTQHTPPVTPAAEGVYAITTTGRETHLAYIITLPSSLGEIQHDLGIQEQGSFITSVKNPKAPGPANANLGSDPGYSSELMNEFRSLRWAPLKPDHLNYESCQFLMIGEGEKGLEKATEAQQEDTKNDKMEPQEELEKLEGEDEIRVEHLKGKCNHMVCLEPLQQTNFTLQETMPSLQIWELTRSIIQVCRPHGERLKEPSMDSETGDLDPCAPCFHGRVWQRSM